MNIHNNYAEMKKNNLDMKNHVEVMYKLINDYAKEIQIKLSYNDDAKDS
ncbi:hypothetical protein [Bacillus sp. FJAT-22090]|nr:hypothetical protein [Bacillus sp. FJAT-22090]